MNVLELYDQFRSDVVDVIKPTIWSDDDVFRYMDDAYKMFVRLTGGIADFTSDFARVNIVTGEKVGEYDKRILRIMKAYRDWQLHGDEAWLRGRWPASAIRRLSLA